MRLIDADALCMHLSDWQFGEMTDGKHNAEYEVINKVIDGIEQEPTVDAVPVVRCKDCKEWTQTAGDEEFSVGRCEFLEHDLVMNKGFCAWGRRKDGEAD